MDPAAFESSRLRGLIETSYPHPIARTFHDVVSGAVDESQGLLTLASVTIRYLALVTVRELLGSPATWEPSTHEILGRLDGRQTEGEWLESLRRCDAHLAKTATRRIDPELAALVREKEARSIFDDVVRFRNDLAHGRSSEPRELKLALSSLLQHLRCLERHRVIVPEKLTEESRGLRTYRARLLRGFGQPHAVISLDVDSALEIGAPYLGRAGHPGLLPLAPCITTGTDSTGSTVLMLFSRSLAGRLEAAAAHAGIEIDEETSRRAHELLDDLRASVVTSPGLSCLKRVEFSNERSVSHRRLEAGDPFGESYRIEGFLAAGATADVYEAIDERSGRRVALKLLPLEFARSPETARRFKDELKQLRTLDHPNVVGVLGHGEDAGDQYIVLELATGWSVANGRRARDGAQLLETHVEEHGGPLPWRDAIDLAIQIAEGLHHVHERGIVHRDMKPHNILLFEDGSGDRIAKIADFGVGRKPGSSNLTLTGFTVGTPAYIAPEQSQGRRGGEARHESDLYSLGVVLYELLCGTRPFQAATDLQMGELQRRARPDWLRRRAPDVPDGVARIVMKCLRKRPEERHRSAAELLADLRIVRDDPERDPVGGDSEQGPAPGMTIGEFKLLERRGTSDEVAAYAAVREDGSRVVVGILSETLEGDAARRDTVVDRLRRASHLRSPYLVEVLDVGADLGFTWFAMSWPEGRLLSKREPEETEDAVRTVLDVANAVLRYERAGMIHGRVDPANIYVADIETEEDRFEHTVHAFIGNNPATTKLGPPAVETPAGDARDDIEGLIGVLGHVLGIPKDVVVSDYPHHADAPMSAFLQRAVGGRHASVRDFGLDLRDVAGFGEGPRASVADEHTGAPAALSAGELAAVVDRLPAGPELDTSMTVTNFGAPPPSTEGPPTIPGYEIHETLGIGGLSTVYAALQESTGQRVAIKVARSWDRSLAALQLGFEVETLAKCRHPNLVGVIEASLGGEHQYIVMELVEGPRLRDLLYRVDVGEFLDEEVDALVPHFTDEEEVLPVPMLVSGMATVARCLDHIHGQGYIHGDVKPGNIVFAGHGRVVLFDPLIGRRSHLETEGPIGTPAYMAPEMVTLDEFDGGVDIWGLGASLYEALTGRRPFVGPDTKALFVEICKSSPPPIRSIRREISRDLEAVVMKMLQKEPRARHRSGAEAAEDLENALAGRPVAARRGSGIGRIFRTRRRRG